MVNNQGMEFLCLTRSRSRNFIFAPAPVPAKSFESLQLLFRLHNAATQLLISRQPLKISNLVADMIRLSLWIDKFVLVPVPYVFGPEVPR